MFKDVIHERVSISYGAGKLAGELCYPPGTTDCACLLINPHPHMGGRMGNNVVMHLAASLAAGGAVTLSFDYAGVGDSDGKGIDVAASMSLFWETGSAPEDPLMIEDARRALSWLDTVSALPLAVVGYSFGAYVASRVLTEKVRAIVLISPTLCRHDFSTLQHCAVPKLIVYSDNDFATPRATTETWLDRVDDPKEVLCLTGGEHFFRGQEDQIADTVQAFLKAAKTTRCGTGLPVRCTQTGILPVMPRSSVCAVSQPRDCCTTAHDHPGRTMQRGESAQC